jgi:hypothetical protein
MQQEVVVGEDVDLTGVEWGVWELQLYLETLQL